MDDIESYRKAGYKWTQADYESRVKGKTKNRSSVAKRTHVPVTKETRVIHEKWVGELLRGLPRSVATTSNDPFDIVHSKFALECRTWQKRNTERVDMHPASRERKNQYLARKKVKGYVVVKDVRGKTPVYYIKEGMAAWRVSAMHKMPNFTSVLSYISKGK